jgi:hypothetical protein
MQNSKAPRENLWRRAATVVNEARAQKDVRIATGEEIVAAVLENRSRPSDTRIQPKLDADEVALPVPKAASEQEGTWQDQLLTSIMNADHTNLIGVLDRTGSKAVQAVLKINTCGKQPFFLLSEQLYKQEDALRDVLGGEFRFERERPKAVLASWLEMVGARDGDTMLHLVLRLNGLDEGDKADLAVELLGRGASWDVTNTEGTLPAMVDVPAFKSALFRRLPAWQRGVKLQRSRVQREQVAARHHEAVRRQRETAHAEEDRARRAWEEMRAKAREEVAAVQEREKFHKRLTATIAKLERREEREANRNPAWTELMHDVRQIPHRIERWLVDHRLF